MEVCGGGPDEEEEEEEDEEGWREGRESMGTGGG